MRRSAVLLCGLIVLAAAPACGRGGEGGGPAAPVASREVVALDPGGSSPADRAIATQQAKLAARPDDDGAALGLANAFLAKARETGDATFYGRSERILADLTTRRAEDPAVLVARGELALALHRFTDAATLGRRAVQLAPGMAAALGVVVDAENELGRYDEALVATQEMVDAKPNLASLSRVSYARELRGDLPGAITAMQQAVTSAGALGENLAYTQVQLGHLLLADGDVDGAADAYAAAEVSFPGFALPLAGQARVMVARGDPAAAADLLATVVERLPTAEHAAAWGDALAAAGRADEAEAAYDLVGAINDLAADAGVDTDLESALFAADHQPGKESVSRARRALKERPSVFAHDALAWNLFRAGDIDAAAKESRAALALGGVDPQIRYHAAAIAHAAGDDTAAARHLRVVLDGNPRFSARHAPDVVRLASELGLGPVPGTDPPCPPPAGGAPDGCPSSGE